MRHRFGRHDAEGRSGLDAAPDLELDRFPFALAHGPRSNSLFDRVTHRSGDATCSDHALRPNLRKLMGVLMLMLPSACSPVSVLNLLAPSHGIMATHDVRYADGDRHGLDIYAPDGPGPFPVVVFVYGGGWRTGSKANYRFVAAALAARGFLTVVPDYRLFPPVTFPGFLQDNAAAIAWTKANICAFKGDPQRLFLIGHSAGAYNVLMLTLDKQWLRSVGLRPDRDIIATVGLAGPYDFLPLHDPELDAIFAPAGDLRLTQPVTFARGDAPPILLTAGASDQTVQPRNTETLAAAIRHDGGDVQEQIYPGVSHTEIIGAFAWVLRWLAPSFNDVTSFLRQHDSPHEPQIACSVPATIVARPAN